MDPSHLKSLNDSSKKLQLLLTFPTGKMQNILAILKEKKTTAY